MKQDRRAYRQVHKAEIAAQKKGYRQSHKAEEAARHKAYREAHKVQVAAYLKAYRQAHKSEIAAHLEAWRQTHKAEMAVGLQAYRQAHPDKFADYDVRRRALKQGATAEKVSRAAVYARDGGRCHLCGKKVSPKRWHLDHLIPLARGGEHSYRNVAVAHPKCNIRKGVKAKAQLRLL